MSTTLPTHPTKTHPLTGEPLRAVGIGRRGPIWPILGASEDPPADPAPADPPADPDPAPKSDEDALGEGGKKALTAEREARKQAEKDLADVRAKVKAFEDAQKTDAEKAAEKAAELEKAASTNAAKAMRYEVAEKAGLPLSAAGRLQGSTEEELLKDAESLKALIGSSTPTPAPTPKADPSQGSGGGKTPAKNLTEAIASHYSTS